MKLGLASVLIFIVFTYSLILGSYLRPYYRYKIIEPSYIRNSYIAEIKGDLLDIRLAEKYLDIFNNYGHYKIVKFKIETNMTKPRPIRIEIRELGETSYEQLYADKALALTYTTDKDCKIIMTTNLDSYKQFESTLIHELLHCYGYDHVNDEEDVMYPNDNPQVDLKENIKGYALEIENRIK